MKYLKTFWNFPFSVKFSIVFLTCFISRVLYVMPFDVAAALLLVIGFSFSVTVLAKFIYNIN